LTKKLAKNNTNFTISISHTTREPRPSEINGKDYYFVNKEEFNFLIKSAVIIIKNFCIFKKIITFN
jgi:guanylate kinase